VRLATHKSNEPCHRRTGVRRRELFGGEAAAPSARSGSSLVVEELVPPFRRVGLAAFGKARTLDREPP
jgi:hypothetical protein